MWTSTEGRTWTEVSDVAGYVPATAEGPDHTASWTIDVTATDNGFVAIGQANGIGAAWTSTDGTSWTSVSGAPFGSDPVDMRAIAAGADELVVIGHTATDADAPGPLHTWWSPDGSAWTEATPAPQFDILGRGPAGARVL